MFLAVVNFNDIKIFLYFCIVNFFSETYHESTQYQYKGCPDPIALHWEGMKPSDKSYKEAKRIQVPESHLPLHDPLFIDGLNTVGVYAVIRQGEVPCGVYYFDQSCREYVLIGEKSMMNAVAEAFPDEEFIREAPILYLYTGVLEQAVWRFREAAYRQVQKDVGAAVANTMLCAKSRGKKVFALGGFVDDSVAVALHLPVTEIPLAAVAVFPENSEVAFNSADDGLGEFSYSNRSEMMVAGDYPARFLAQNRSECISELDKCVKVRRVVTSALPGDEFPLTPSKFPADYYLHEMWFLDSHSVSPQTMTRRTMDLDDFSSMLRWLEIASINAFGAGLLKIWIVSFDVMFVYPGVYRYIPVRKSIYMQSGEVNGKKFAKGFVVPDYAQNASFAVLMTANLNEACGVLGERAYRYLNMNAGVLAQSLDISARMVRKVARDEHYFIQSELKKLCGIPETESLLAAVLVGSKVPASNSI